MAKFLEIHAENPQSRLICQAADALRGGGILAVPTDCCYVFLCRLDDKLVLDRLRSIRQLSDTHLMTLMCMDLSTISKYAHVNNSQYRLLRLALPGAYTFILPASRELPRRVAHPKRKTIGLRIPQHKVCYELLANYGDSLLTTSLILPGQAGLFIDGEEVYEQCSQYADVIFSGRAFPGVTTVIDLCGESPALVRKGLGSCADIGVLDA